MEMEWQSATGFQVGEKNRARLDVDLLGVRDDQESIIKVQKNAPISALQDSMRNLDPQNLSQSGLVELQYEYLIVVQKTGNLQPIILKAAEVELPIPNRSRASMDNEPSFCSRTSNNARLKSLIRLDKMLEETTMINEAFIMKFPGHGEPLIVQDYEGIFRSHPPNFVFLMETKNGSEVVSKIVRKKRRLRFGWWFSYWMVRCC
ncbi:hypothetical protein Peur_071988 [Populus x canadensis]